MKIYTQRLAFLLVMVCAAGCAKKSDVDSLRGTIAEVEQRRLQTAYEVAEVRDEIKGVSDALSRHRRDTESAIEEIRDELRRIRYADATAALSGRIGSLDDRLDELELEMSTKAEQSEIPISDTAELSDRIDALERKVRWMELRR